METTTDNLSAYEVEDRILASLKERDGTATAGDVAADTGLGLEETEQALRRMLSLYRSHLDVDDDGNLRYRFDPTFERRGEERGRMWYRFKKAAWRAFVGFFKVWTMVMLVGYTIAFVLILLAIGIAGFAASASNEDNRGGGIGVLPFLLVARFLEFMFWFSVFSDAGGGRRYQRRGMFGRQRRQHKKPTKPFYQKIFDYLFGVERSVDPLAAEKAFAQFVRARGGRITAAEWASRTGMSLEDADNALTGSVVRFDGDVDVTDDGVLVYRFDQLRVTAEEGQSAREIPPIWERKVKLAPFTGNPSSTNTWISVLNGFNLAMASFVLFGTVGLPLGALIGLGWVPFVFSLMFFAVPLLRLVGHKRDEKKAARENERRQAIAHVFQSTRDGEARPVPEDSLPERLADRVLVDYEADIQVTDAGLTVYTFDEVARQIDAGRRARISAQGEEVVFGRTVFSSDEEERSLEDYEMEEFDRRLARELGGSAQMEIDYEVEASPAFAQTG